MDELESDAVQLEAMLPRVTRVLFRHGTSDPLGHLSVAQLRMMRLLAAGPRIAVEMSAELGMSPSAISQATHRLERMGMVVRRQDVEDRRVKRLELSATGANLMRERQAVRVERARQVLSGLGPSHRRRLIASLEELLATVPPPGQEADPLSLVAELEQAMPPVPQFPPASSAPSPNSK